MFQFLEYSFCSCLSISERGKVNFILLNDFNYFKTFIYFYLKGIPHSNENNVLIGREHKRGMCFMFPFCSKSENELWEKRRTMTTKPHLRIKAQDIDFNKNDLMNVLLKLNYYREFVRSSKNKLSIG